MSPDPLIDSVFPVAVDRLHAQQQLLVDPGWQLDQLARQRARVQTQIALCEYVEQLYRAVFPTQR